MIQPNQMVPGAFIGFPAVSFQQAAGLEDFDRLSSAFVVNSGDRDRQQVDIAAGDAVEHQLQHMHGVAAVTDLQYTAARKQTQGFCLGERWRISE